MKAAEIAFVIEKFKCDKPDQEYRRVPQSVQDHPQHYNSISKFIIPPVSQRLREEITDQTDNQQAWQHPKQRSSVMQEDMKPQQKEVRYWKGQKNYAWDGSLEYGWPHQSCLQRWPGDLLTPLQWSLWLSCLERRKKREIKRKRKLAITVGINKTRGEGREKWETEKRKGRKKRREENNNLNGRDEKGESSSARREK